MLQFGNSSSEEHVKLHERVKIGVATKITGRDTAVVGLARGTEHQTNNVLMEACRFNVLDKCLFSTHFRRCAEFADCAQGGNLRLGAEDEQHCEPVAEHGWVPLLPEADPDAPTKLDATWRFALEGLSFDGESLELGLADTAMSISGTPYVWLPENVYNAVMEKLKASEAPLSLPYFCWLNRQNYSYDCIISNPCQSHLLNIQLLHLSLVLGNRLGVC